MLDRRAFIKQSLVFGVGTVAWPSFDSLRRRHGELITRRIPSSGERVPSVGLGGLSSLARVDDRSILRELLGTLIEHGGSILDTGYGRERDAAVVTEELGVTERIFWSTKVDVRGDVDTDRAVAARNQVESSINVIPKLNVDLVNVQIRDDISTPLGLLRELKQEGAIRYLGLATTFPERREALIAHMRTEPLDFVAIDYSIANRWAEDEVLPLAQDRGIAVMVYRPFDFDDLWSRVRGVTLPRWVEEVGAISWAQFFVKFLLGHPAVTVVTPGTSRVSHLIENLGAARGPVPTPGMRARMISFVEAL